MMYVVVPMLLGRAYNLSEVGLYHLPDVTLMVAVSVVADLVAGTVMLVLIVSGHQTHPSEPSVSISAGGGQDRGDRGEGPGRIGEGVVSR